MTCLSAFRFNPNDLKLDKKFVLSTKAGPNFQSAMRGVIHDTLAWRESPLFPMLEKFILLHQGGEDFLSIIKDEMELLPPRLLGSNPLYLGRLALKEEAAGKVRVFAITDLITQTVMKPLHDLLFGKLKNHPCDGTFNQTKPLDRLVGL